MLRILHLEDCVVDLERHKVYRPGHETGLSTMECALLRYLAERAEEAVDQDTLLREVWRYHDTILSRTVRVTIGRLRKKIERDPSEPVHLVTVYGQGYAFRAQVDPGVRERFPSRVPAEVDPFFGRAGDLEALLLTLAEGRRLVTLTGPPGIGKTRLAQRHALSETGRVWFADLTATRSGSEVIAAVAETLHLPLEGGAPAVEQVGLALRGRERALLVLDNCEQVADSAAEIVAAWLRQAPMLGILVTSREPLRLQGEAVHQVGPLDVAAAVALFTERARLTRADPDDVGAIVEALDRIPLVLELAASRVEDGDLAALRRALPRALPALATDLRDVSPRHTTLRAALDWSWDLLSDEERHALARCTVFRGGWTLDAAVAVLGPDAEPLLERLSSRSLVRAPRDGRYRLFESVRAYAEERLDPADPALQAHGRHFAALGTDAALDALLTDPALLHRVRAETDNLVIASERAAARGDVDVALAACLAASRAQEGMIPGEVAVAWTEPLVDHPGLDDRARARLLLARGHALRLAWRIDEAKEAFREVTELARVLEDRRLEGLALHGVGLLHAERGTNDALESLTQALAALRDSGDRTLQARVLNPLGIVLGRWDFEGARAYLEEALALSREMGDAVNESSTLGNYAQVLRQHGRLEESAAVGDQALALARGLGTPRKEAMTLVAVAMTRNELGEYDAALALLEEAATVLRELGLRRYEGHALASSALAHKNKGLPETARPIFLRAIALFREAGAQVMEAMTRGNLGSMCLELGDLEEARLQLERAVASLRAAGNTRGEGGSLGALAEVRARSGQIDEARADLDRAESLVRAADDPSAIATLLCRRARIELAHGQPETAHAAVEEAAALVRAAGIRPEAYLARQVAALREQLPAS